MIPPSSSRPFGRPSPQLSETDLAKLIKRTIELAAGSPREMGWAAVSMGCDGRKRTTMFDGSACQTEGEVCIAQRQDGITSCVDTPAQGNGMTTQSITFAAPVCTPATGWYILDEDGYLYRIPTGLVTAAPYWPPSDPPYGGYDFVRLGTWARLMCAEDLAPVVFNGDGGSTWDDVPINTEESVYAQVYETAIGGCLTHLETIPSLTPSSGQVVVAAVSGRWTGLLLAKATTTTITLSQNDVNGAALSAGEAYKVLLYAVNSGVASVTVSSVKGVKAAAADAVAPENTLPLTRLPLGIATVAYGGTVTVVSTGTTTPVNLTMIRALRPTNYDQKWSLKGLVLRDADAPNAGLRYATVTLPTAGTNVVTGSVRVAWGYPLALEMLTESVDGGAPFGASSSPTTRDDYDMAFVYDPPRLGVEYGAYHLNLSGPDIDTPGDSMMLSDVPGDGDYTANVLGLPSGEVALLQPYTDAGTPINPPRFKRLRIRPAPDTAPSVALSQVASSWPNDTNDWVAFRDYPVNAWVEGATSFTLSSGTWTHGRPVPCVLWYYGGSGRTHWTADTAAKVGQLEQPTGAVCSVTFTSGGAPAVQGGLSPRITILGQSVVCSYGYTFTYRDPVTLVEYESALSPMTEPVKLSSTTATYTATVTVPIGPTDTCRRTIYRFAYDYEFGVVAGVHESPWDSRTQKIGTVYDRMMVLLDTIEDNVTTTYVDAETTLTFAGTRPPSPIIEVGSGITWDIPGRPIALPPLDL